VDSFVAFVGLLPSFHPFSERPVGFASFAASVVEEPDSFASSAAFAELVPWVPASGFLGSSLESGSFDD